MNFENLLSMTDEERHSAWAQFFLNDQAVVQFLKVVKPDEVKKVRQGGHSVAWKWL